MAKSVEIIKEILESENKLISKYTEAVEAMVHPESRSTIEKIGKERQEIAVALQEILKRSSKCPAIHLPPEAKEMLKDYKPV
ncbi:MAG: hypothetical protein ACE5FU_02065 [Nitrospinota bacterium]